MELQDIQFISGLILVALGFYKIGEDVGERKVTREWQKERLSKIEEATNRNN